MNKQVEKLIEVAQSFVGYLEKKSDAMLENFTANAGSGNFTIFGRWYNMNGFPWCAMFVSFVADKAGIPTTIIPKHASCAMGVNWFKRNGRWHAREGYKPVSGDIIYFTHDGANPAHVGLVTSGDSKRVYTIEGNTSGGSTLIANGGGVAAKAYPLSYKNILGYGHPAYSDEPATSWPVPNVPPTFKRGDKGDYVRALQDKLNALGFPCGTVDGDFGIKTDAAVRRFQTANSLAADGVVGPLTWKKLLQK